MSAVLEAQRENLRSKIGELEQIEPTLRAHSRFVRFEGKKNETEYQFAISHPNDAARQITLTVLAFDIPRDN